MPGFLDIAVVGGGAAGLMAAVQAGRAAPGSRVAVLDGVRKLGAKILVSGGGRCNVTHHAVDETAFFGSSRNAIRRVLRRFEVADTVAFFADLGIELKREETGKLFPVSDAARTVLEALFRACRDAGVELRHPWRVGGVEPGNEGFLLRGTGPGAEPIAASRVILATGGKSLPKSGSDGGGYALARALGHSLTPRIFPGLVPLTLEPGHPLTALSGVSFEAGIELSRGSGRRTARLVGSVLCTHFGVSGPAVLDISRLVLEARFDDSASRVHLDFLPGRAREELDRDLPALGARGVAGFLRERLPERLVRMLCGLAGIPEGRTGAGLTRPERRRLLDLLKEFPLPVTGDRGFRHAEVTAGGVPLSEVRIETLESRCTPGLYLCGEICDVDGRIGGFNFQWAWASGAVAGRAAAAALAGGA